MNHDGKSLLSAGGPAVEARRLDGPSAPEAGDFSYVVMVDRRERAPGDKRGTLRQRTRLRSGKILDAAGRFVTECLVFDRSEGGCRLRLPAGTTLPASVQFYDDEKAVLHQADIVWRREQEIGMRFRPVVSTPRARALAADMRRRFYAVPN